MNPPLSSRDFVPPRLDLYLDGPLGRWALDTIARDCIHQIFTTDSDIVDAARLYEIDCFSNHTDHTHSYGDIGISIHYHRIFSIEHISRYRAIYNLHPGFLPWGRGYFPVFWAIWEDTPAGASLIRIDAGIDTGPLVGQLAVTVLETDTGRSLHQRVQQAEKDLFLAYLPKIAAGALPEEHVQAAGGTYHSRAAFYSLRTTVQVSSLGAADLLRLVRAFTFAMHPNVRVSTAEGEMELCLRPLQEE